MADYTFDALNKSTDIALSDGDLVATGTSTTDYRWVAVTVAPNLELGTKLYTEFEIIADTYDAVMLGVIYDTTDFDYNHATSYQQKSVAYSAQGYSYYPPAGILGDSYRAGDIISITVDEVAKDVSFYKNNVFQFTVNAPDMTGPYRFTAYLARYLGVQPSVKFLPSDSHNYTPPSGFTAFGKAPANPNRPDVMTQLYNLSSVKGNIRGKASEGFYRPTVKQFFTSTDFEEIESGISQDNFNTLNTSFWKPFTEGTSTVTADGTLNLINDGANQAGVASKGVIKGDFEFEIDFDASAFVNGLNGQIFTINLTDDDYYVDEDTKPAIPPSPGGNYVQLGFYEHQVGPTHKFALWDGTGGAVITVGVSVFNKIGKLKFKRTGSTLEAFYYVNSWVLIGSKTYLGTTDLYIIFTKAAWGANPEHVVKLDNLNFISGKLST